MGLTSTSGLSSSISVGVACANETMRGVSEDRPVQITQSQAQRLRTPMMGMIITMAVLVGILALMWFMNPEPDVTYTRDEDVPEAAGWADEVAGYSPIAPDVPAGWTANYARWETRAEHGVEVWEVGYTTDAVNFLGFAQTDNANPAWVNDETEQAQATGTTNVGGLSFETRERGDRHYYVLAAEDNHIDGTTVVISSDAGAEEAQAGLEAIVDSIGREVPDSERNDGVEENDE